MRFWGPSYAELVMDGNAIDNATDDILLSTNAGAGSILRLRKPSGSAGAVLHSGSTGGGASLSLTNDVGTSTIFMDGDLSSDASVVLPGGAISALEQVNEPGIASDIVSAGINLVAGFNTLASRTIVAPSSGYILAIGTCYIFSGSSSDSLYLGISTSSSSLPTSQQLYLNFSSSGSYYMPITVHGSFPINAGAQTFYFLADQDGGSTTIAARTLSLIFVPTSYGTFDPPASAGGHVDLTGENNPDDEWAASIAENSSRLDRELALVRAQAAEQAERIRKLEAAAGTQLPSNPLDNPEN